MHQRSFIVMSSSSLIIQTASYVDLDDDDDGFKTKTCLLQKCSLIGTLKATHTHTHTHHTQTSYFCRIQDFQSSDSSTLANIWLTTIFFKQMHTEKKCYWRSLLFYLRVITEKSDIDGKVLQNKEPEEMMTIKETGRIVPWNSKGMGLQQ